MRFKAIERLKLKVIGALIPWPTDRLNKSTLKKWGEKRNLPIIEQIEPRLKGRVLEFRWNKNSLKLGKRFIKTFPTTGLKNFEVMLERSVFESPVAITISPKYPSIIIAQAKLNFSEIPKWGKSVLVEGLQGKREKRAAISKFHRESKMPWANFMLQKAIEHAKRCGFKAIGIIDPECLYWYHDPASKRPIKEVQEGMRKLYRAVAKNLGFDVEHPAMTENAIYWMKKL